MRLIERYLLRRHLWPAAWAVAALSILALLSQALSAFQFVDARPETLLVLAKVTLLAYPQLLGLLLPVALFVSVTLVLRRLVEDREIAVCFASGMDRWSVTAPAAALGGVAALLTLAMNLWVGPPASRAMRQVIGEARADVVAAMVHPGAFTEPAPGITFYAEGRSRSGGLRNLFLHQDGPNGGSTYVAREGRLEVVGGRPLLLMRRGSSQRLSANGVLDFVSFDAWTFDLSPFVTRAPARAELSDYGWSQLSRPAAAGPAPGRAAPAALAEANQRLAGALYAPAFALLGVAGSLAGAGRRDAGTGGAVAAGLLAAAARIGGFAAQAAASRHPQANGLQYLIPLAAGLAAVIAIFGLPRLRRAGRARRGLQIWPGRLGAAT